MSSLTIPANYIRGLLMLSRRPQSEMLELLALHDLPTSLLDSNRQNPDVLDARKSGRLLMDLLRNSQKDIDHDGQSVDGVLDLSAYRLLFTYIAQAPTLGKAFEHAELYFERFFPGGLTVHLFRGEVVSRLILKFPEDIGAELSLDQFSFSKPGALPGILGRLSWLYIWQRLGSWLIGQHVDLIRADIDLPPQPDWRDEHNRFDAPLFFNSNDCAMQFGNQWLNAKVVRTARDIDEMLATFPDALFDAGSLRHSVVAQVRQHLIISKGKAQLEAIASVLAMTPATLHRRLKDENSSFRVIKEQLRLEQAMALLREAGVTVADVSESLGFSDAASFGRAFKQWTGITPRAFRDRELRE